MPVTGSPVTTPAISGGFVLPTLAVVLRAAGRDRTAAEYYTAGQQFTGAANGAALTGDYLSAAAFLGVAGTVAVAGFDGITFAIGSLIGWVVYATVLCDGAADPAQEIRVARGTALVVGVLAVAGGILANGQNVAVLIGLAFGIAASANLPALLYTLFWRRFNVADCCGACTAGSRCRGAGGVLPRGQRAAHVDAAGLDFAWFPLANPGLVAVPVSFLLGAVGTLVGRRELSERRWWAEMEVRAITGAATGRERGPSPARPAAPAIRSR